MEEKQIERWEAQREIKNLMGRYVRALLHKEEGSILHRFWSHREDISLGRNEGWYLGRDSIENWYRQLEKRMEQTDQCMKKRFGGVQEVQQGRGIGYLPMQALSSDLVELAQDGESARGMWACSGQDTEFTTAGPVTMLTFGTYGVDFVREEDGFRILHMQYLEEIRHPQGEKWWNPPEKRPPMPEFADLAGWAMPEPDVKTTLYTKWEKGRKPRLMLALPEPYDTLTDTISYGYNGEGNT